jgi:hypothetical protein
VLPNDIHNCALLSLPRGAPLPPWITLSTPSAQTESKGAWGRTLGTVLLYLMTYSLLLAVDTHPDNRVRPSQLQSFFLYYS